MSVHPQKQRTADILPSRMMFHANSARAKGVSLQSLLRSPDFQRADTATLRELANEIHHKDVCVRFLRILENTARRKGRKKGQNSSELLANKNTLYQPRST